jgi:AraC-like DNA-binding protein
LRFLLQQRGESGRISKVVEYIHQNLDKLVSVEDLATMGHMSRTAFCKNLRNVMHLSPYQYAKSVKLYEAQRLLKEEKKSQRSGLSGRLQQPGPVHRECKRHFGFSPSAT